MKHQKLENINKLTESSKISITKLRQLLNTNESVDKYIEELNKLENNITNIESVVESETI